MECRCDNGEFICEPFECDTETSQCYQDPGRVRRTSLEIGLLLRLFHQPSKTTQIMVTAFQNRKEYAVLMAIHIWKLLMVQHMTSLVRVSTIWRYRQKNQPIRARSMWGSRVFDENRKKWSHGLKLSGLNSSHVITNRLLSLKCHGIKFRSPLTQLWHSQPEVENRKLEKFRSHLEKRKILKLWAMENRWLSRLGSESGSVESKIGGKFSSDNFGLKFWSKISDSKF